MKGGGGGGGGEARKERGVAKSSLSQFKGLDICTELAHLHADGSLSLQVTSSPRRAKVAALKLPLDFVAGPQHVTL